MPIGLYKDIWSIKPYPARLMGIDQGTRRIGIAVSDPGQMLASAVHVIEKDKFSKDVLKIKQIWQEYNCGGFVVGLPLNMDGSEGPRCDSVRDFAKNLSESGHFGSDPWVALWDERLSTAAVQDFLIDEVDMNRKRRKQVIDKLAAQNILQGALDFKVMGNH